MNELITGVDEYLSSGLLLYYYSVVFLSGLFLLFKYEFKRYSVFIILLFWEGIFVYAGNSISSMIYETYKIFIVLFVIVLFWKDFSDNLLTKFRWVNTLFFFYTLVILTSMVVNSQPILTSLSQYGKKYLLVFLIFHGLFSKRIANRDIGYYKEVLFNILFIQILLSFFKIAILGFGESIVGSIAFIGGGYATILPVLAFLFIWQNSNGILKPKDLLMLLGFLVIAIVSNKRAPIFILPVLSVVMYTYVYRTRNIMSFIKYIPLVLAILYIGIRSNPSLNPERSRWGSFDLAYATDYATDYMFGSERQLEINDNIAYGRGGSFVSLLSRDPYSISTDKLLFGQGVTEILKSYEEFNIEKYGVSQKGALNGAMLKYISYGFLGLLAHFSLGVFYISISKRNNFFNVLLLIFVGDFLLYDGNILENGAMAFVLFLMVKTNSIK